MTEHRLRWAVVGMGRHADLYIAPAIRKAKTADLAAIVSRDLDKARSFAEKYGAPKAFPSVDDLLADGEVDAVFLCSPNFSHAEQTLACAAAGKHVLCEKPLAPTPDECATMVGACTQAGVKLGTGFHLRHNPVHVRLKALVDDGTIGEPQLVEVEYFHHSSGSEATRVQPAWRRDPTAAGGGRFLGTGLHAVDLARFVVHREATHISAVADEGFAATGYEKFVTATLRMEGDLLATAVSGPMRYPFNHVTVYGSLGSVRATKSIGNYGGGVLEVVTDAGTKVQEFGPSDVYEAEVDAFAEAVWNDATPHASGQDGLRVAEITASLYASMRSGAAVTVDRAAPVAR